MWPAYLSRLPANRPVVSHTDVSAEFDCGDLLCDVAGMAGGASGNLKQLLCVANFIRDVQITKRDEVGRSPDERRAVRNAHGVHYWIPCVRITPRREHCALWPPQLSVPVPMWEVRLTCQPSAPRRDDNQIAAAAEVIAHRIACFRRIALPKAFENLDVALQGVFRSFFQKQDL